MFLKNKKSPHKIKIDCGTLCFSDMDAIAFSFAAKNRFRQAVALSNNDFDQSMAAIMSDYATNKKDDPILIVGDIFLPENEKSLNESRKVMWDDRMGLGLDYGCSKDIFVFVLFSFAEKNPAWLKPYFLKA